MGINEAAPAVTGGKMENDVYAFHHLPREAPIPQVSLAKLNTVQALLQVLQLPAGEIVCHTHAGTKVYQFVHQMASNERSPPGYQDLHVVPICHHCPFPVN